MNRIINKNLKSHMYYTSRSIKKLNNLKYYVYNFYFQQQVYCIYVPYKFDQNIEIPIRIIYEERSVWETPEWFRFLYKMCVDEYFKEYKYLIMGKRKLDRLLFDFFINLKSGYETYSTFLPIYNNKVIEWFFCYKGIFIDLVKYLENNGYVVEVLEDNDFTFSFTIN